MLIDADALCFPQRKTGGNFRCRHNWLITLLAVRENDKLWLQTRFVKGHPMTYCVIRSVFLGALAISITERCDGCINTHARKAVKRGATEAEVGEVIGVAILMSGGPATVYGPRAFAAFREYEAHETTSTPPATQPGW